MATNTTIPINPQATHLPFHYVPTESVGIVILVLFGLSTTLHILEAIYYRIWWLIPTVVVGGFGELIGWSGRVWGAISPHNRTAFIIQISTTIISPTFVLAAIFIIFGRLIHILGSQYSRFKPKTYTIIFCSCDLVALIIQAVGGATASKASSNNNNTATNRGGNIMLGGICFQLLVITVFTSYFLEYCYRYKYSKPLPGKDASAVRGELSLRPRLVLIGVAFSVLCLFIRAVYRTGELAEGWSGYAISTEAYFIVLDGFMIIAAMVAINVLHPGLLSTVDKQDLGAKKAGH